MAGYYVKFYCQLCKQHKRTSRGMCEECGSLIGCSAIQEGESRRHYGCSDNEILLEAIQRLKRQQGNLLGTLRAIVKWNSDQPPPRDYVVNEAVRDIKQMAQNILKDHESKDTR
jgi:predicted amidophosphoribosyltransferase